MINPVLVGSRQIDSHLVSRHNTAAQMLSHPLRVLVVLVLVLLAGPASAQTDRFDPELRDAVARLDRARGPEAVAALRRIWDTWDRADPTHVEEQLLLVEQGRWSPAMRVYAGTLAAYARLRRGDVTAARRKIAELGFIDEWIAVGPFDNEGKAGFAVEHGPELDFTRAIIPGRAYTGKERPVRWRTVPAVAFPYGWLDTGALLRPAQHACVYVSTFVQDTQHPERSLTVWVGTSGAFKLFFNGQLVLEDEAYRGYDSDRHVAALSLHPGPNNLTVKACGEATAPVISVRLADDRGIPDADLTASNDMALSEKAAELAKQIEGGKPRLPRRTVQGPIEQFEKLVDKPNPTARDLFAYAEYLVYSDADDPAEHRARDYSRRAAEKEPTVERLLLAGMLAEDRNQAAEWLAKAARLAQDSGEESVDVLLAQAAHARGGVNWRDAFPYLDRVLALDPNHVAAIRGRIELYNEAGLRRTALDTLERALQRNPTSVNLTNMYASQLRALGRSTAASEAEARYATLRFDDRGYLSRMIELAVARRNQPAAQRWIDRLLAVAPDSQWALGVAARSYRELGQPERAIATYQTALELAPEDVSTLRTLADLHGELGLRQEQLTLLRRILKIRPQEREVREYLEHIEPPKARPDEAYAWKPDKFLDLRQAPARGQNQRTLRDLTVTTVYANGKSSKFRQIVYQPLTDAAAAALRQYAFQYHADREVVQLRGARVYRKDGKVDEAIEYGEGAADLPWISMYTSARTFYIQLPRLEPGDVVELTYRVDDTTSRNEFADYFGEVVYLQSNEPVANAEYVLITPRSRQLYIDTNMKGLKRSVKESGKNQIYRFYAKSVPAIEEEPAMPPLGGVLGHVHVSTYANYQEMGRWYWGLSKDQLELDDETRELARKLGEGAKTDMEKVRRVFNWVVKNTRYVALEFGIYGYKPRRCVQTVARGWGDCKDKATVIVALLKELGVDATLVVVRTQNRGDFASKVASLAPFDHAIAYVPSLDLYLDGTAEYAGATELPEGDLEALALQINQGNAKLVHLPKNDPKQNLVRRVVRARLDREGGAQLDLDYHVQGTSAPAMRLLFHAESTLRERVQTTLVGKQFPGFELAPGAAGVKTNDLEDLDQPVDIRVRGNAPSFARREGDQLSMAVTASRRLTPAYASLPRRRHDVRLLANPAIFDTFVVHLAPGMKVTALPPEQSLTTPFGSFSITVEQKALEVTVKSHLEITTTRVTPDQYAQWQAFCNSVDSALSHRLLVKP
jgi:tetratricopeptide (TPR) repeat protein